MSASASTRKGEFTGKIAVVGGRQLTTGYRLLGVSDTFLVEDSDAPSVLANAWSSGEFSLIIVDGWIRSKLSVQMLEKLEASTVPLVVFMPELKSEAEEEPLAALARRVLGVDISSGGKI